MISRSALVLAGRRALAVEQNDSICKDKYAKIFVDNDIYDFVKRTDCQIHGMLMRSRYMEDQLDKCIDNLDLIINLGAGLDTKYQRYIKNHKKIRYIEFDKKSVLDFKTLKLKEHSLPIPEFFISNDLNFDNFRKLIVDINPALRVCFIAEGFFMYWPKETLSKLLKLISNHFKSKINFIFDHHQEGINQKRDSLEIQKRLKKSGELTISTLSQSEVASIFTKNNYHFEFITPKELAVLYYNTNWEGHNEKYICSAHRLLSQ